MNTDYQDIKKYKIYYLGTSTCYLTSLPPGGLRLGEEGLREGVKIDEIPLP